MVGNPSPAVVRKVVNGGSRMGVIQRRVGWCEGGLDRKRHVRHHITPVGKQHKGVDVWRGAERVHKRRVSRPGGPKHDSIERNGWEGGGQVKCGVERMCSPKTVTRHTHACKRGRVQHIKQELADVGVNGEESAVDPNVLVE